MCKQFTIEDMANILKETCKKKVSKNDTIFAGQGLLNQISSSPLEWNLYQKSSKEIAFDEAVNKLPCVWQVTSIYKNCNQENEYLVETTETRNQFQIHPYNEHLCFYYDGKFCIAERKFGNPYLILTTEANNQPPAAGSKMVQLNMWDTLHLTNEEIIKIVSDHKEFNKYLYSLAEKTSENIINDLLNLSWKTYSLL